jgi:hypothetical protein
MVTPSGYSAPRRCGLINSSRRPDAAALAVASPPGPRKIHAQPSASIAPISGPATYAQ